MKFSVTSADGSKAAIIDCPEWEHDATTLLERIRQAVTQWIDTTTDGQRAKMENHGRFTFEDLAGYVPDAFLHGTALGVMLFERGIKHLIVHAADADPNVEIEGFTVESNLYTGE